MSLSKFTPPIPPTPTGFITPTEFTNLMQATADGGTLDLDGKFVLIFGRKLVINQNITIINGGFKRDNTPVSHLVQENIAGNNQYYVDTVSNFRINDWVMVGWGQAENENTLTNEFRITAIDDINNIITAGVGDVNAPTGSYMVHRFSQMDIVESYNVVFDNIVFDGNKAGNDYTYDWKANKLGNLWGVQHLVKNSFIINSPCESFTVQQGVVFSNNTFYDLNGSIIHFSNPLDATVETLISNNYGDGVCMIAENINGHNEGCWTNSNKSQFITIENNRVKNGGNAVYGVFDIGDDYNFNVSGNVYTNFNKKVWADPSNELDYSLDTFINVPN